MTQKKELSLLDKTHLRWKNADRGVNDVFKSIKNRLAGKAEVPQWKKFKENCSPWKKPIIYIFEAITFYCMKFGKSVDDRFKQWEK